MMINKKIYTKEEINTIKTIMNYTTKEKEIITNDIFNKYEYIITTKQSITHYLFAIVIDNKVYTIKLKTTEFTSNYVKLSTESRGGLKLKMRITKAMKLQWLKEGRLTYLCTIKHLNKLVAKSKYNKGEIIEKILTEKRGQEWKKDSTRFDKSGDIDLKRDRIQVKFENASLTSLKAILNAMSDIQ